MLAVKAGLGFDYCFVLNNKESDFSEHRPKTKSDPSSLFLAFKHLPLVKFLILYQLPTGILLKLTLEPRHRFTIALPLTAARQVLPRGFLILLPSNSQ